MTEAQIEQVVCTRTDRIDAAYMAGKLTDDEYKERTADVSAWADRQRKGMWYSRS